MRVTEKIIHNLLLKDADSLLKKLSVAYNEFRLLSATDLLRREVLEGYEEGVVIGRIDVILKYRGRTYITEIKYDRPTNCSSDFWESLKILGYTEYYKWQTGQKSVTPAIIVPLHSIKLEQQIIAGALGLAVFAVYEENGKVKLKLVDERPIWKQDKPKEKIKSYDEIF